MSRMLRISTFALLLCVLVHAGPLLQAQEPATIDSEPAVRFEQSPGYFNYAAFCRTPKEFSAQIPKSGLPLDKIEFGIGWYVTATVTRTAGASPEADGRIIVSPQHVRFMPRNPQFADAYVDFRRGEVEFKHSPGEPGASLRSKDAVLNFRFSKICLTCAPGTPVPPGSNAVLLEREFALLGETLTQFESGWRATYRLSKGAPVDSPSRNQAASVTASTAPRSSPERKTSSAPSAEASPVVSFAPAKPEAAASSRPKASVASNPNLDAAANSIAAPETTKAPTPQVIRALKGRPVKISSADGLLVKKVAPKYPLEAKIVRLEGTVVLRTVIDKTGDVSWVSALSGPPLLESAAVEAVRQWQYRPFSMNGQPVEVETTVEVVFALDGSQPTTRAQNRK
jgi:TonB family protein